MSAPTPTARGARLASRDPDAHPYADVGPCQIPTRPGKAHPPHPYGAIHERGGLAHWCPGKETP